jgi:hypothetical protein
MKTTRPCQRPNEVVPARRRPGLQQARHSRRGGGHIRGYSCGGRGLVSCIRYLIVCVSLIPSSKIYF